MSRSLLASALATALSAASAAPAQADGRLTIYSGDFDAVAQSQGEPGGPGFALVDRKLSFELRDGANEVSLGGLPRALDSASVVLTPPAGVAVRGQRFDFALADQSELLRRALGQQVSVEQAVGNERQVYTGTLVAAGDGLTLRLPDGRIKVLSQYSSFELPRLPAGVVNEPTLSWTLAADRAGRQAFDLGYASAGLAWRAEYRIDARGLGNACRMSLEGAAMVVNRSGADFDDVQLTLVAGEPNRASPERGPMARMVKANAPQMMVADAAVAATTSGEYQSYRLPLPGSLPQGAVQRLPLVEGAHELACERRYETQWQQGDWRPPYPMLDANFNAMDGQAQPVVATLRFKNAKATGLGMPLPAGRVRMFDGADFLGESQLGHTPANQDVALEIGNVFDLTAERTREDFQLDRDGRNMSERVSVKLRNARAQAVTVRVSERLARWTDWEITGSSVPHDKRNAQTASFDVVVPAEGEATLSYQVRYRWAADVKIP
jgi:hypothetical protein